jgi:hypothetical protein
MEKSVTTVNFPKWITFMDRELILAIYGGSKSKSYPLLGLISLN